MSDTERKTSLKEMLDRVYGATDMEALRSAYDEWANDYDADLVDNLGWDAPVQAAAHLARHIDIRDAPVLDVGAGTGLVGEALAHHGFQHVEALDLSANMLETCRAKGVYRGFHQAQLGGELPLPSDHFAAVVAVGVLTEGHAKPDCFAEITRIIRPGGRFVFALRPDVRDRFGFKEAQEEYTHTNRWSLMEESPHLTGFRDLVTAPYQVWVYEVTS